MNSICRTILPGLVALALSGAMTVSATTLKIATVAPEGSGWMVSMRAGAKEIEERTGGRVEIKFYGGGVMGNDKRVMRKMRVGQLHGGAFVSAALAERFPEIQLYGLPLLFRDLDEVDYVRARTDEKIIAGLEAAGLVSFGLAEGGFARIMSNTPVTTLSDLQGQKVWVPEGDEISYAAMKEMGLAPVTLPLTDVLTGLQTGLIDIIASSPVGALVLQWHTKVKYVSDLPVSYIVATLVIEQRYFDSLSAADQQIVRDVMGRIYREFDKVNREDNIKAAQALANQGIESVRIDASGLDGWRAQATAIRKDLAQKGSYSPAALDEIEALLKAYRDRSSTPAPGATQ